MRNRKNREMAYAAVIYFFNRMRLWPDPEANLETQSALLDQLREQKLEDERDVDEAVLLS